MGAAMSLNSRSKGKRGELECAADMNRLFNCNARRGQQRAGGPDSPDVIHDIDGLHLEVKRVEAGNPYTWIAQAVDDAGDSVPLVWHKRNNKPALAVVRFDDLPRLAEVITRQEQE